MGLADFLASATGRLSVEARGVIVAQAILLLDELYAHLPLKRSMYGIDPVQRLRSLRRRVDGVSELAFHREMLSIFTELRDLHTSYTLPEPFLGHVAFLPFLVEELFEGGERRYLVSKVARAVADPHFRPGVVLTHWCGVPLERAVEVSAERQPGSTSAARRARGLGAMTLRPLASMIWPDEEWIDLRYQAGAEEARELRLAWRVMPAWCRWLEDEEGAPQQPEALAGGLDRLTEVTRHAKKLLFAPDAAALAEQAAALREISAGEVGAGAVAAAAPSAALATSMPDNFSARAVETAHGPFGLVRIWSFENTTGGWERRPIRDFVEAFAAEFLRLVEALPRSGLILDLRGNPGGRIPAGERLLELLTPVPIVAAPLCLRNTPLVAELCRLAPPVIELGQWEPSVRQAAETGAVYSRGWPFLPFSRSYNNVGQRYHGPVILLVDGLCYSTTDIFAAGFQDHGIGPILGLHENTGAGGGNNWTHAILTKMLERSPLSRLEALPAEASFTVALRQVLRVGARAGAPLEDLGVVPDHLHQPTRDDLLAGNRDLIEHAAAILATMPVRALDVVSTVEAGGGLALTLTTRALSRVDVYADERPCLSLDVVDGACAARIPAAARRVELRGFEAGALVARRIVELGRG